MFYLACCLLLSDDFLLCEGSVVYLPCTRTVRTYGLSLTEISDFFRHQIPLLQRVVWRICYGFYCLLLLSFVIIISVITIVCFPPFLSTHLDIFACTCCGHCCLSVGVSHLLIDRPSTCASREGIRIRICIRVLYLIRDVAHKIVLHLLIQVNCTFTD